MCINKKVLSYQKVLMWIVCTYSERCFRTYFRIFAPLHIVAAAANDDSGNERCESQKRVCINCSTTSTCATKRGGRQTKTKNKIRWFYLFTMHLFYDIICQHVNIHCYPVKITKRRFLFSHLKYQHFPCIHFDFCMNDLWLFSMFVNFFFSSFFSFIKIQLLNVLRSFLLISSFVELLRHKC